MSKIKIKNVFYGVIRHIDPSKEHPERIRKVDKKLVKHISNPEEITEEDKELLVILLMMKLTFLCKKKILAILR